MNTSLIFARASKGVAGNAQRRTPGTWLWAGLLAFFSSGIGAALAAETVPVPDPPIAPKYKIRLESNYRVTMRDGVRLALDLYFPDGPPGKWPVLLMRTPYDKNTWRGERGSFATLAEQGFVVAIQDLRGSYRSEGKFDITGADEANDAIDTLTWLAQQPWSSGRLGAFGCSAMGHSLAILAPFAHPNLRAMVIGSPGYFKAEPGWRGPWYINGVLRLRHALSWTYEFGQTLTFQPPSSLSDAEFANLADRFTPHSIAPEPAFDAVYPGLPIVDLMDRLGPSLSDWRKLFDAGRRPVFAGVTADSQVATPVLWVNSWHDPSVSYTIDLFNLAQSKGRSASVRSSQYLVLSPAPHCQTEMLAAPTRVGEREFGDGRIGMMSQMVQWFGYWLRDDSSAILQQPKVRYFLMGENRWHASDAWPPRSSPVRFYLDSGGTANSRFGDGRLQRALPRQASRDTYIYDPATPRPSAAPGEVGVDQRQSEMRNDVLVYTSSPLEEHIPAAGRITLRLFVSSSAPDTDFTARLLDVYPDDRAFELAHTIVRMRYRDGPTRSELLTPGRVYPLNVVVGDTANDFLPGHRIRVEISSSDFPEFARNLNTGADEATGVEWRTAVNSVRHGPGAESYLQLPTLPP